MSSTLNDPRERTLVWLNAYFTAANVTDDNANTTYGLTMYQENNFPTELLFVDYAKDYVITVSDPTLDPLNNHDYTIYGYRETVPITVYVVDKADLTAQKTKWQVERELRRISEQYLTGSSLRLLGARKENTEIREAETVYSYTYELDYVRASEYTPSYPTLTWGPSATPTGTYKFPNAVKITSNLANNDIFTKVGGRVGQRPQRLGSFSLEIKITCDLGIDKPYESVSVTGLTWKRPQTASSKTDKSNFEVFLDIMHNGSFGSTQTYQTLKLDWCTTGMKVRLTDMEPDYSYNANHVILTFKEVNDSDASTSTYAQRWGI